MSCIPFLRHRLGFRMDITELRIELIADELVRVIRQISVYGDRLVAKVHGLLPLFLGCDSRRLTAVMLQAHSTQTVHAMPVVGDMPSQEFLSRERVTLARFV